MRKGFLLSAAAALLLACGGEDNVSPGERHLAFSVQPSTTVAGQVMTPAVQVSVRDAADNTVTSGTANITLNLLGTVARLNGQTTRPVSNGVAVFSDLRITKSFGSYFLKAFASDVNGATSTEFAVQSGPASAITIKYGDAQLTPVGTLLARPPAVLVTDELGNPVPDVSVAFEVVSGGGNGGGSPGDDGCGWYCRREELATRQLAGTQHVAGNLRDVDGVPSDFHSNGGCSPSPRPSL